MILKPMQILRQMTYLDMSEHTLCEALNELKGKIYTRVDILNIMHEGCSGVKAKKIAFVLGLPRNKHLRFPKRSQEKINEMKAIKQRMFRVDVVGHLGDSEDIEVGKKVKEYRGVSKIKSGYMAQIHINGGTRHLGSFPTREEAALAWNKAAAPLGRKLNEVSHG